MLTEETVTRGDWDEFGNVFVETVTRVKRDGEVIAESSHRRPIPPDAPLTGESAKVKAIAEAARKGAKKVPG